MEIKTKQQIQIACTTFILSSFILIIKFYAYMQTGSKAIMSDALESIVNVVAALVLIIVVYYSQQPADQDHPYGHGKIEYFGAAFEGGSIFFAGIFILIDSGSSLWGKQQISNLDLGLWLTVGAGLLNGIVGYWLKYQGEQRQSLALASSGAHLLSDFKTTVGLLIGLFLVRVTNIWILDSIVALIFGIILIYEGAKILKESGSRLLDARDFSLIENLAKILNNFRMSGVIQIHSTRIIRSGNYHHIDLHMVVPEFWSIDQCHQFCDSFENKILQEYSSAGELHFHLDPCRKVYCANCDLDGCPIRINKFEKTKLFTIANLISPVEPN